MNAADASFDAVNENSGLFAGLPLVWLPFGLAEMGRASIRGLLFSCVDAGATTKLRIDSKVANFPFGAFASFPSFSATLMPFGCAPESCRLSAYSN